MNEYQKQAQDFLIKTSTSFSAVLIGTRKYFPGDEEERDVYSVELSNERHCYAFEFGDSLHNTQVRTGTYIPPFFKYKSCKRKEFENGTLPELVKVRAAALKVYRPPVAYDILTCLGINDFCSFEDFCAEFGYDKDSRAAMDTCRKVQEQARNLKLLFTEEELELLGEIQ